MKKARGRGEVVVPKVDKQRIPGEEMKKASEGKAKRPRRLVSSIKNG